MAIPFKKNAAPIVEGVNFGDLGMYAAGGGLPEGDYIWSDLTVKMHQSQNAAGISMGPPRLGVLITLQSLTDPSAEARTQFYSMGSAADKSFAPNPNTGKGLVAVPGGPGATLNNSTNWAVLLQSLYDCGLPVGVFLDDVSALEGTHVHMANIPEPEARKGYQSNMSEVSAADSNRPKTIAVVTEIKDDGKPWEGTGGVVEAAPAKVAPKVGPKAVAKPALKAAAKPAPVAEVTEDDVQSAAINGVSAVLEKNANGCTKLALRTGTFKAVNDVAGGDMAQAVIETYFSSDDNLNIILGQLGYVAAGIGVKPA